ncbi:MAG TPA: phenylacetate-CoA oxygenase subunit PaaJ [Bacteroidia bacterium]|nr:phenylacetate-CoA oxygenase subunit PaaJ [Bacteroidia bacterium]
MESEVTKSIHQLLAQIPDPEIPVISIVDLGIVRSIEINGDSIITVTITPTYSGCPAMRLIEDEIKSVLKKEGYKEVFIKTTLTPAWTTDWLSETAKQKLMDYGIAPPEKTSIDKNSLLNKVKIVHCPQCKSTQTEMISQFGSTACKALYRCLSCKEPFDYFKCI